MRLYYVTFPDDETRERLANEMLDENLATCVNAFPIDSIYLWKGEKEVEGEVVGLFKTADGKGDEFVESMREEHPYEVPCIMEIPVKANREYEEWIERETG